MKVVPNDTNKKVLVTGAAGFIGSNLSKNLLKKGYEVYGVDNFITGSKDNVEYLHRYKRFHFFKMDINSEKFLEKFKKIEFRYIYHLACPTGVPNLKLLAEEMILTNSIGTINVMEIAREHDSKVVFSSSAEIYGEPQVLPQSENYHGNVNPVGPRSAYEEGKRFSESILAMYTRKYGVDNRIVRFFNVYGPGMSFYDNRVIPQFLYFSVKLKKDLVIYGDGSQTRTFLYIDDLVKGLFTVMHKGRKGEVYNIGGNTQTTIKDLSQLVMKFVNDSHIKVIHKPHFIEDHTKRLPTIDKLINLGWKPEVPLEIGLESMFSSIKNNGDKKQIF